MNKFICIFFVITTLAACTAERPNNLALDRKMTELLDKNDYFRLETVLNNNGSQLSEAKELYFRAFLENAFNQTEQSLQTIDRLFSKHKKLLNDSLIAELLTTKADNHIKRFEYKPAAEILLTLIESYSHAIDSADLEDLKKNYPVFELLKNVPAQKIHQASDVTIPVNKNEFGHVTMQVICNGVDDNFVFDTGANLSVVVETAAKLMGIKPFDGSVQVGASTGEDVNMKMGVADSLQINGLLFENVVFLILPDEQLSFPEVNYYIRGIIGFPVMYQMKEIRIDRAGSIVVPQTPVKKDLHNLFMNGLEPIVQLESGRDTLLFMMDTGASTSEFSKKYFDTYKESIIEKGVKRTVKRGGAGGIIETEIYELAEVPFKIGNFQMILPEINVETREYSFDEEDFDGNLGQDVLMHFDEMILNFESMYLTFK